MEYKLEETMKTITLKLNEKEWDIVKFAVWQYWHKYAVTPEPVFSTLEKILLFKLNRKVNCWKPLSQVEIKRLKKVYGWK